MQPCHKGLLTDGDQRSMRIPGSVAEYAPGNATTGPGLPLPPPVTSI
jgi:hypothetical protein